MSLTLVFVYGTLKRGFCRHRHLASQHFHGEASTEPRYRMVNCGDYPGLLHDPERGRAIRGEVWRVDATCLERLDGVEGVADDLYARERIELAPPFAEQPVEAYFYRRDASRMQDAGDDWRI